MDEVFRKAVALIGLGLLGCGLLAILVGIAKAMFSSSSGTSSRRYRSGGGDDVQWYDKGRP